MLVYQKFKMMYSSMDLKYLIIGFLFSLILSAQKNQTEDDQKIIELLEDISRDMRNYDLEFRIQELESKFSVDMSETTFNELKELKKKQNLN